MPNRSWILAESLRQDDSVLSTRKEPDLSRGSPKINKVDAELSNTLRYLGQRAVADVWQL